MTPIGTFYSSSKSAANFKHEVPRQSVLSSQKGEVRLIAGQNFEQALEGIEGFARIWLIFGFHQNTSWKPKVLPQNLSKKVGVFATRSPYRPNSIGLSCVGLDGVKGRVLSISESDLTDGTPIYDIKPYLPYADSFDQESVVKPGCWWSAPEPYGLEWSSLAKRQSSWLEERVQLDLKSAVKTQLEYQPLDQKKKRVVRVSQVSCENSSEFWQLSFRTWRVFFEIDETHRQIQIHYVDSGLAPFEPSAKGIEKEFEPVPGKENSQQVHQDFRDYFVADFTSYL